MTAVSKIEHGVVELRTDVGRLYVCPTLWQRLYLRWTFRNFHSLPQQILNRRQKRLIEGLSRNAILTPADRVPASAIIGIVENMRVLALPSTAEMAEATATAQPAVSDEKFVLLGKAEETVLESSAAAPAETAPVKRAVAPEVASRMPGDSPASEIPEAVTPATSGEDHGNERRGKRNPWTVALLGASVAVVLVLVFWTAPLWRLPQLGIAQAPVPATPPSIAGQQKPQAAPVANAQRQHEGEVATAVAKPIIMAESRPAAKPLPPAASATSASPSGLKQAAPAPAPPNPVPDSAALPQIEEAPRSGFIYPVAPNPNLVGKVVLKAVVGSDGSVKQVEVLSGDRALAAAAVRAVRQWRYAPARVDGRTGDAQTHVTISFLGDDAVSVILPSMR
ncbi:MAG TPA: TonB family protein [Terriglobales bacterium]|nr:TonB family protein [Terriglobales bacterium]